MAATPPAEPVAIFRKSRLFIQFGIRKASA